MYAWKPLMPEGLTPALRLLSCLLWALVATVPAASAEEMQAPGLFTSPAAQPADSNAAVPVDMTIIEDEEAPAELLPGEAMPADGPMPADALVRQGSGPKGPKTSTDKIVDKFMKLDVDASFGVSMDEYITVVQQRVMARYAAMDADKNGEVTEDEYRAFWKSRMAKWYRLKR
ncbi:MAG: hypothetical protein Q9M30_09625 [Mariprofundaceae bacterium]|nr:hypothetical protein [Mariprofundaceae bacterium]